jgi:hypothetical protein
MLRGTRFTVGMWWRWESLGQIHEANAEGFSRVHSALWDYDNHSLWDSIGSRESDYRGLAIAKINADFIRSG